MTDSTATRAREEAAPPSPQPRGRRLLRALREDWISLVTTLALLGLVVVPIGFLVMMSFRSGSPTAPGGFTFANYERVYADPLTYQTLGNTVVYALVTSVISLTIAALFAYLLERTDLPFRNLIWVVMLLPIAMPALLSAMSWILALSQRTGVLNIFIRDILSWFGIVLETGPFNIHSLWGVIFVESIRGSTTLFLMMVASFRLMDPSMEEAASMAGAKLIGTLRKIVLPLLLPILLATAMYGFIGNLDDFDVPLLIGLPGGVFILSTLIYFVTYLGSNWGVAAVYSTIFIAMTVLLVAIYHRVVLRNSERFATITGKAFKPRRASLGKWKWPALALVVGYFMLSVIIPFFIILYASLLPVYQVPSAEAFSKMSLGNYVDLFGSDRFINALWNSTKLGVGTGVVTMVLAMFVAWVVVRRKVRGRLAIDALAFIPHALPSVAIVIALVAFYLSPWMRWLPLYGTLALMILALVTRYIAFGTRTANGAMAQIDSALEEAAAVGGVTKMRILWRITLPLLKPAFIGGFVFVAAHGFRNLTIPLMMASQSNETVAVVLYQTWEIKSDFSGAGAIGVVLTLILAVLAIGSRRWIMRGYTGQE